MKLIKVTLAKTSETILINPNAILNVNVSDNRKTTDIFIWERFDACFTVKETLEEIYKMVNER